MTPKSTTVLCVIAAIAYVSVLFFLSFFVVERSESKVEANALMIRSLMERKEYHIVVSEDNNRLLRSIESQLERCCNNGGEGDEAFAPEEEEGIR